MSDGATALTLCSHCQRELGFIVFPRFVPGVFCASCARSIGRLIEEEKAGWKTFPELIAEQLEQQEES